jgi:hypothetical protein
MHLHQRSGISIIEEYILWGPWFTLRRRVDKNTRLTEGYWLKVRFAVNSLSGSIPSLKSPKRVILRVFSQGEWMSLFFFPLIEFRSKERRRSATMGDDSHLGTNRVLTVQWVWRDRRSTESSRVTEKSLRPQTSAAGVGGLLSILLAKVRQAEGGVNGQ